jgi:hypothetical protein
MPKLQRNKATRDDNLNCIIQRFKTKSPMEEAQLCTKESELQQGDINFLPHHLQCTNIKDQEHFNNQTSQQHYDCQHSQQQHHDEHQSMLQMAILLLNRARISRTDQNGLRSK